MTFSHFVVKKKWIWRPQNDSLFPPLFHSSQFSCLKNVCSLECFHHSLWMLSVSPQWKLYAFTGIWYKSISHCQMFSSQKSAGIISEDMMFTTAPCQAGTAAYFPTVCKRVKRHPADWSNGINVGSGAGSGLERAASGRWDGNSCALRVSLLE